MSACPPEGIRTSRKLKVRTGCITCKIRKVKCDEAKPFCKRCSDTGRKCDGYAAQPERKPTKSPRSNDRSVVLVAQRRPSPHTSIPSRAVRRLAPATLIVDADFLSPALSGEESSWVEFFSMRTGPALSSVFSHSFWSLTLPQLSVSEPAIRHAVIALGSAHARYEADATNNQVIQTAVRPNLVLWHYNEAIRHLQTRLSGDPQASDVALLCCLMFVSLECLHGNRNLVMDHLKNGLNILQSSQAKDSETGSSSNANSKSISQEVRPLFHRLDSQTTLMGHPASTLFNHMDRLLSLSTPRSFKDFEHAKSSLDLLVASSLGFIRDVYDGKHADSGRITLSARTLQIHLLSEFAIWNNSMADFVKACNPFTDDDNKVGKSLRVQHTATFIWLSRCTELEELGFDAFLPEFASIVKWSRILMMPAPEAKDPCLHARLASLSIDGAAKFSLNMAYIPPLYLVAIKCRDPITRREAISILEETNGREGLWDARLHAKVARRLVEIEETSVLIARGAKSAYMEPGPLMRIIADGEPTMLMTPPEECFRVHDMDLRDISEGFTGTCSINFSTFANGMLEQRLSWTETLHF